MLALARSAAASVGAAAGTLAAIVVGGPLAALLFIHIGEPVVEGLTAGATEGRSGIEAVFAGLFAAIGAVLIAILIVAAIIAPLFVLLPLAAAAIALRLTGAGLILRSLWLMIVAVAAVVVISLFQSRSQLGPSTADIDGPHSVLLGGGAWILVLTAAGAAFVGRLCVELWNPDRAASRLRSGRPSGR